MTNSVPPADAHPADTEPADAAQLLRPQSNPLVERLAELIGYYGAARLAVWTIAGGIVLAVGWWMLRPAPAPTESLLPAVTTTTLAPSTGDVSSAAATTTAGASDVPVVVHVAGAVAAAGVYEIPAGGRVHEAIEAAGGPSTDADLDRVNLAAALSDGARVHVPAIGEPDPPPIDPSTAARDDTTQPAPVDVNRAGPAELERLPGVGPSIAAAIVEERDRGGPFGSVDDLQRVSGIGPVRLDAIRDLVVL